MAVTGAPLSKGKLCIVVPCHNEEESIPVLFKRMKEVEPSLACWLSCSVEYVLVNDGSKDRTLSLMRELHKDDPRVHYLSFSRNFGKEAALEAGLQKAVDLGADFIADMDADLQDPPELLSEMFSELDAGHDVAAAYRTTRNGEPPIRSWFARRFYGLINGISDVQMKDGARDFRLMRRRVVVSLLSLPEVERFSKGIFQWVGYDTAWIAYENIEREHGQTNWSFWSLLRYAVSGIVAFSTAPLEIISALGVATFAFALLFLLVVFLRALAFGDPVAGWPSMMCAILMLGGANLLGVGLVGLYLSKVYAEVKRRPLYLLAEVDGECV